MMTLAQLKISKVVPRGKHGSCVPAAISFATGANFHDVEALINREQPSFRPDFKTGGGVRTDKLLGKSRRLFDHTFTEIDIGQRDCLLQKFCLNQPKGTFLVRREGHAYVVRDGKVFDWFDNTHKHFVLQAWRVEKIL